jgi:hypothetical protein
MPKTLRQFNNLVELPRIRLANVRSRWQYRQAAAACAPRLFSGDRAPVAKSALVATPLSLLKMIKVLSSNLAGPVELPNEPTGGLDARFCEVMDAAPFMIWAAGKDRGCLWFNRPWLRFTGRHNGLQCG